MYYTEDKTADVKRKEAEEAALDAFSGLVILKPNLVYGPSTYLMKFMQQSIMAGKIPTQLRQGSYLYKPIHHDDIAVAIKHAFLNKISGVYSLNGRD